MPLLKDAQGQLGTVQEDQILEALRTGTWWSGAENSTIAMISPEGKRVGIKFRPDEIQARARQGFRLETADEEHRAWVLHENKSDAAAFALGAMRGVTFGASDWALNKSGLLTGEQLAAYAENSPGWSTTGEILGAVAPALATGGAGILPKMSASAAKGVLARTPAGLLAAGSTRLEAALVNQMGNTALRKAAAKGAALGLEGAVYGGGQAVLSDPVLTGDPIVAEQVLTHIGLGAITGVALGAGTSLIGSGVRKAAQGIAARRAAAKVPDELLDRGTTAEPVSGPMSPPPSAATPGKALSAVDEAGNVLDTQAPGVSNMAAEAAAKDAATTQAVKSAAPAAEELAERLKTLENSYKEQMERGAFEEAEATADAIKAARDGAKGPASVPGTPSAERLEAAQKNFEEAQHLVNELEDEVKNARTEGARVKAKRKLSRAKSKLTDAGEEKALAMEESAGLPVSGGELGKIRENMAARYPKAPKHVLDDLAETWSARDKAWKKEMGLKNELERFSDDPAKYKEISAQIREQKDIVFKKRKHFNNVTGKLESEVSVEKAKGILEQRTKDLEAAKAELLEAKGKNPRARIKYKIKKAEADIQAAQKTIDEAPPSVAEPLPPEPGTTPPTTTEPLPSAGAEPLPTEPVMAPEPSIQPGTEVPTPAPAPASSRLLELLKNFPGKIGQIAGAFEKGGGGKVAPIVGGYIGYKGAEVLGLPPWIGAGLGGAVLGPMLAARAAAISARAAETVLESRVAKVVSSAVKGTINVVGGQGPRAAQRLAWEAFSEDKHKQKPSLGKLEQGESIQKAFDRALTTIEKSSDPETFVQAMQEKFSNIANASPALMTQISAAAMRAFVHLREKAPKLATISPQQIISGTKPRASSNEIREWFDRVDVAFRGLPVVMERMSRGTLTPQMVETAQAVFPGSYEKMVQQVAFQISERAQKGGVIDRRFKLQMAMLGVGLDSDLISAADNSFAAKEVGVVLQDKQLRAKPGSLNRLAAVYNQEKRAHLPADRNQSSVGMTE